MRKKSLVAFFVFILLPIILFLPSSLAEIEVNVQSSGVYLSPGNFTLIITSTSDRTESFGITVLGGYRNWVYFDRRFVTVYPGKTQTVNFNIQPPERIKSGIYSIPILLYSLSDENVQVRKEIKILIPEEYKAEFSSVEINKKSFQIGDTITIKETVKNTGTVDLKDIKLSYDLYRGDELLKSDETSFILEKGKNKEFEQKFIVNQNTTPGDYEIKLYITIGDRILDKKTLDFNIAGTEKIEKKIESSWTPIGEFGTIYVKNIGNIKAKENITIDVKQPWDIFLTSSQRSIKEYHDGYATYIWTVHLDVGKETRINYQVHYWPLIVIFIIVVYVGYWTFKNFRKPKLKKYAVNIKELDDDRKEIMVSLEIKNIGERMENVAIEDLIPPVAKLIKDFKTMKPQIKKTNDGTKIVWNLKELQPFEERILTYKMETLIGTLDYLKLPKAKMSGIVKNREITATSNHLKIEEK